MTVAAGTAEKHAVVAPGSIDEGTGAHLYGTLTVGSETQTNSVTLGSQSVLRIGIGPKDAETRQPQADKLVVHGNLQIGANCTLDLVSNSAVDLDEIVSGTYTIAEADKITGEFSAVLKPRKSWKVAYETVGESDAISRVTLTIPQPGMVILVQ